MKKLVTLLFTVSSLFGQQQVVFTAPSPVGVTQGTATVVGNTGIGNYYYWIIAKYPRGNASHSPVINITNGPNVLNGSNYVRLNWNQVTNAIGYDIIKSTNNTFPSNGNIALATNITGSSFNDTGNLLTSYTVTSIPSASEVWYLDNQNCASPIVQMPSVTGSSGLVCTPGFLKTSNNLSDLSNVATARSNLGLTSTATTALSNLLQSNNNLSELTGTASTARANLGINGSWLFSTATTTPINNAIPYINSSGVLTQDNTLIYQPGGNGVRLNHTNSNASIGLTNTSTSGFAILVNSLGANSYNNLSQAGDSGLVFTPNGLGNPSTGGLVIGPWNNATNGKGFRVDGNTGNVSFANQILVNQLVSNGSGNNSTILGSAAGSGATVTGGKRYDSSGAIVFTTGTSPTGPGNSVVTVNLANSYASNSYEACTVTQNSGLADVVTWSILTSPTQLIFYAGTTLQASHTYTIAYICMGN